MNLDGIKLAALAGEHQVATIDPKGILLHSCHSLLDLRASIGEPFFECFDAFLGLESTIGSLSSEDPELCLPKIAATEFGSDEHLDFRFKFRGEGQPTLLLISAHKSVNDQLRESQQQRNETSIAFERQGEQGAVLRAENGSLRKYAHVLAHDLKAPLRGISHLAEWIEEAIADGEPEKVSEYLGLLKSRTERIESLVEGILGYSLSGGSDNSDANVATAKVVEDIVSHDLTGLGVTFHVDEDLPTIEGSPIAIRQVFSNLISNAVKHGRADGAVVTVSSSLDGGTHRFTVTDNGRGIPMEEQARIFEPFEVASTSSSGVGRGLGLGIATKIVEAAGGTLGVISQPGSGATFWFSWPVPRSEQVSIPAPLASSTARGRSHE